MTPKVKTPLHGLKRRGPRPLGMHIGMAIAEYGRLPDDLKKASPLPQKMIEGIRLYQAHPFCRPVPDHEVVWRLGQASLLRVAKGGEGRPILLIPSLINRSHVFDLLPENSFARFLQGRGRNVFVLDWGEPSADPEVSCPSSLVARRLVPALEFLRAYCGAPCDAAGYCLGGTFLAGAACVRPELAGRIVLLAGPWDFHAGDGALMAHLAAATPAAYMAMAERGVLPSIWIQTVFAALDSGRALRKFSAFSDLPQNGEEARLFVTVEDWLNDGVDIPAPFARALIGEWYGGNTPGALRWTVDGRAADPAALPNPCLAVAAARDRIAPPASVLAFAARAQCCDRMVAPTGHIGLMAGRGVLDSVWMPVFEWLRRDGS